MHVCFFLAEAFVEVLLRLSIGSDDSESGIPLGMQSHLMDKVGLAEGALHDITDELQHSVSVSRSSYVICVFCRSMDGNH